MLVRTLRGIYVMPYLFQHGETIHDGLARIVNEQLIRAREQLTDRASPEEKRVHDARKRFKETRALLRMVREPLGPWFPRENAWFRDAGRGLAAARDAEAVLEALEKLELPPALRGRIARTLKKQRTHPPLEGLIANTIDQLVVAQARIGMWPQFADSFDCIADGLSRSYRGGRRLMKSAGTPAELHEWRKQAKTHWYHLQLLRDVSPAVMKGQASLAEDLSHALGDHHDLQVLGESIAAPPPELIAAIAARQRELETEAVRIGAQVYAETPKAWLARMRRYWNAWRG
jgi:CHAD domain-containing protein